MVDRHRSPRNASRRLRSGDGSPPSSVRRRGVSPTDEEDGYLPYYPDEGFIQLADEDDWPRHWRAGRLDFH